MAVCRRVRLAALTHLRLRQVCVKFFLVSAGGQCIGPHRMESLPMKHFRAIKQLEVRVSPFYIACCYVFLSLTQCMAVV
jgi:hypothetical protein